MYLIRITFCLVLFIIGNVSFSETQPVSPPPYTHAHLISTTLWTKHLEVFKQRLANDAEAARTELQKVGKKLFGGHILTEEWVPLYFRISRNGTEYLSDVRRLSELEIRMLTVINAKKYAEHIRQHKATLAHPTTVSRYENLLQDAAQTPEQKRLMGKNLRAEKMIEHAASYEKLLQENPEAAHAELVKYTHVTFGEHPLTEEWIALYVRLSREKEATFSEFIQLLALGKNMLEDNFPEIAAEAITLLDSSLKSLRAMSRQHVKNAQKLPFRFSLVSLK